MISLQDSPRWENPPRKRPAAGRSNSSLLADVASQAANLEMEFDCLVTSLVMFWKEQHFQPRASKFHQTFRCVSSLASAELEEPNRSVSQHRISRKGFKKGASFRQNISAKTHSFPKFMDLSAYISLIFHSI